MISPHHTWGAAVPRVPAGRAPAERQIGELNDEEDRVRFGNTGAAHGRFDGAIRERFDEVDQLIWAAMVRARAARSSAFAITGPPSAEAATASQRWPPICAPT